MDEERELLRVDGDDSGSCPGASGCAPRRGVDQRELPDDPTGVNLFDDSAIHSEVDCAVDDCEHHVTRVADREQHLAGFQFDGLVHAGLEQLDLSHPASLVPHQPFDVP